MENLKIKRFSGKIDENSLYSFIVPDDEHFNHAIDLQVKRLQRIAVEKCGTGYVTVIFPREEHRFVVKHIPVPIDQLRDMPNEMVVEGLTFHKHFNMAELTKWHEKMLRRNEIAQPPGGAALLDLERMAEKLIKEKM